MRSLLILLFFVNVFSSSAQNTSVFDQKLADSLGADKNGMKLYQFVMLTTGPNKSISKDSVTLLFNGHMENMGHLVKAGKLIVAGPFGKNENNMRGLFILNTATKEEAEKLLETDPAIKNGLLHAEITPWYGSAAMPMYLPYSEKIRK